MFDSFDLYLWRSSESPGVHYLARSVSNAEAMCLELMKEGYIVKVVRAKTDQEYELREGALLPVTPYPISA